MPIMLVAKDAHENHLLASSQFVLGSHQPCAKNKRHTFLMHLENHLFLTGNQSNLPGGANTSPSAVLFGRSCQFSIVSFLFYHPKRWFIRAKMSRKYICLPFFSCKSAFVAINQLFAGGPVIFSWSLK